MPKGPPLSGELSFSLSFPGRRTKQLADLVNVLYEYAKAVPEQRPKIAAEIETRAKKLLGDLGRSEGVGVGLP
jgi:hypothetical protein